VLVRTGVALLAMGVLAPSAVAGASMVHMHRLGSAVSGLYTDGVRYAAFEPTAGTTLILDTRTRREQRRADPPGCTAGLVALGVGELLYDCSPSPCGGYIAANAGGLPGDPYGACYPPFGSLQATTYRYEVVDVLTGVAHQVAGLGGPVTFGGDEPATLEQIGSTWAAGFTSGYHANVEVFLNWHTGQSRYDSQEGPSGLTSAEDLNRAGLLRALCRPLQRAVQDDSGNYPYFEPFLYARPFALNSTPDGQLQLLRCGSRRSRTLAHHGDTTGAQLGASILSWPGGTARTPTAHTATLQPRSPHWLATIRTYRLPSSWATVQHTATSLYATVTDGAPNPPALLAHREIYSATIP
jgi:hypothetical protein